MISKKVQKYLTSNKVKFLPLAHKTVFTAYDAAQTLKVKLGQMAKSLLLKVDKRYFLVSLPADKKLDFSLVQRAVKQLGGSAKKISLVPEKDMTKIFRIKPGTLTAFGSLHKVKTIIDRDLKKAKEVIVGAGSVTDSIRMKFSDYAKLEGGLLAAIGVKRSGVKTKRPVRAVRRKR